MTPKVKRILTWVGYVAFYLFALVFFAYLTFPYDRLRERVQNEFNARQTGPSPLRLKLGHISAYWLSGVEADNIELVSPPSPSAVAADEPDKPLKPKTMRIESAHARVSLLRLLVGTVHVDFGANAFGGNISGFTSDADNGRKLEVELEDLSLAEAPLASDLVGLPVAGRLSGQVELLLPEAKLSKSEGKLSLRLVSLTVGDGKAKIRETLALPKLEVGELELTAEAVAGTVKVGNFSAAGKDLEFRADGSIRLRDPFDSSTLSLNARFKFNDRYVNKDDMTRALFGTASIQGLFDMDPTNRRAKRADGFYGWRVNGLISRPVFVPSQSAVGEPSGATLRP